MMMMRMRQQNSNDKIINERICATYKWNQLTSTIYNNKTHLSTIVNAFFFVCSSSFQNL